MHGRRISAAYGAIEEGALRGLVGVARQFIAWKSIVDEKSHLNLDENQVPQATESRDDALRKVETDLRSGYRWALAPARSVRQEGDRWIASEEELKAVDIAARGLESSAGGIAQRTVAALDARNLSMTLRQLVSVISDRRPLCRAAG